ncbi:MAG: DinB family protein, partial [Pseudomonadota bacterium]
RGEAGSKTSKADIVAALQASIAECDKAYDSLTDASAVEMMKMGRRERSKLGTLDGNTIHDNEEYGYLAVYLRLKGVVPPSSAGR